MKKAAVLLIAFALLFSAAAVTGCSTIDERHEIGTDSCVE